MLRMILFKKNTRLREHESYPEPLTEGLQLVGRIQVHTNTHKVDKIKQAAIAGGCAVGLHIATSSA